ncbi:MAG: RDD family protein [Methanosarcinales archaeon]|nr:MAG: RDD family protein [Methanosarcinales archaeon]
MVNVIAGMELASIGARFVSYIADNLILIMFRVFITSILSFILPEYSYEPIAFTTTNIFFFIMDMSYFIYFFEKGQTLGMMMTKVKLCRTDGTHPIGYKKGAIRWIVMGISETAIGLGFLWILLNKNRQGWHDTIAGTYVVVK